MDEKDLIILRDKKLKICKITTFILLGFSFIFIPIMATWLLIKNSNKTAMFVLSIIAGVLVLLMLITCFVHLKNQKDADKLQNEIDNI